MPPLRLLILGGTTEGKALAQVLAERQDIEVVSSLAGRTQLPVLPPGTVRIGGFGGTEGLVRYLSEEKIRLVIDATHPYAAQISRNAAAAAAASALPLLRLERPPWRALPEDNWLDVASLAEAATEAAAFRRVFLSVGGSDLVPFAGIAQTSFLVRRIDLPREPMPLTAHEIVLARGPFAEADERRLLETHAIEAVVSRNSGGEATYGKIAAARALGLPVIMVARPLLSPAQRGVATAASVPDALRWLHGMRVALTEA
jgi:precorrin-6A/cobalt-precorrin-6A reductase